LIIRDYCQNDAAHVGLLIKATYSEYNLDYLSPDELPKFLGPFACADNPSSEELIVLDQVIRSEIVLVAEDSGRVVGVLRGRPGRLGSLFVARSHHNQGIGGILVENFESQIQDQGGGIIRVASTIYAVPFYLKMGYKKSTGIRKSWSFDGYGLPIQPMRKVLPRN
jgi:GNAT superfamily N-acetyltransferase